MMIELLLAAVDGLVQVLRAGAAVLPWLTALVNRFPALRQWAHAVSRWERAARCYELTVFVGGVRVSFTSRPVAA